MQPSNRMAYNVPIVSMRYARRFVRFMESKGIGRQALLKESGVDPAQLANPDAFLSMNQVIGILNQAEWLIQDERTPFEFGQQLDFPAHGLLGYALLGQQEQDQRKLVSMIVQYLRVGLPVMEMELSSTGTSLCIRLRDNWDLGDLRAFMAKIYMGSIHALASQVCRDFRFEFDFPTALSPRCWQTLARGAEMQFGSRFNQVTMPLTGRPVADGERNLAYSLARARSREEMEPDSVREIVTRVRERLMNHPGRGGDLDTVAADLGMSPRSLRHHLALAGTSFRDIRNDIRRTYANRYLTETDLPLEVIADRMGFSDQASFTRAFRRWTGQTPGEVRRRRR
ncbi:AraC family transcriptional regulator [Marinobacter halodurans]|uniref:AraC family transcriptional regulator n=1 Tax=Marinobacter halodurans TaxID=2528979 RepID=A0ABY1ZJJ3_9GAMM|nr:AraC family transcriptional regulator [Marinobacter halodurans]TBW55179.1 AraC family transcriptional regulator [Marinobacter halodurans]